ncbi:TIGR03085 family protein [Corynebacterium sp. HMSC036E10]|uniref:TIGR03085 family protein n=1 Tax=Corynebacterium coyleae TaxID=53374 RepID=A0ABX8KXJ7_9CORY|nr:MULTISPECIES: TIGR03085 family metal-binding protein [Corynebacterium]MDK6492198.1 TIGR03085 family metal-binding protein [Corynebacterium coyleae]OFO36357.1 TIGR03085 family protein [Corynebacterium sp. HMSC075D04]OHO81898.1 TIGR03085 family protein [Corynebacterium sp. HMSC036E10]OHQ53532.1 TIGR03085 family protein [Corynebacterium sp. HMSC070H05]PLA38754.1 TIGR03085 family protein [Corynebacterium coyleae]
MSFAQRERSRLAELFLEVGPDAPTLNEGWNTFDLAAHLLIRESKPLALPGMFVDALSGMTEKETSKVKARPYTEVVNEWAAGPPVWIKPFDAAMNTAEHFIHHEDVRRGGGEVRPRDFSRTVNAQLLALAKRFGAMTLRKAQAPVILTPPDLPPVTLGDKAGVAQRGDDVVRVSGAPGELLLWVSGRNAAEIELTGALEALDGLDVKI